MAYNRDELLSELNAGSRRYETACKAQDILHTAREEIKGLQEQCGQGTRISADFPIVIKILERLHKACGDLERLGYESRAGFLTAGELLDSAITDLCGDIFGNAVEKIEHDIAENQHLAKE